MAPQQSLSWRRTVRARRGLPTALTRCCSIGRGSSHAPSRAMARRLYAASWLMQCRIRQQAAVPAREVPAHAHVFCAQGHLAGRPEQLPAPMLKLQGKLLGFGSSLLPLARLGHAVTTTFGAEKRSSSLPNSKVGEGAAALCLVVLPRARRNLQNGPQEAACGWEHAIEHGCAQGLQAAAPLQQAFAASPPATLGPAVGLLPLSLKHRS